MVLAVIAVGLAVLAGPKLLGRASPPMAAPAHLAEAPRPVAPISQWTYAEQEDALRGQKIRYAILLSSNAERINSGPYDTIMKLIVRSTGHRQEVIFQVFGSDALFSCNMYANQNIPVRFDGNSINNFRCATSDDGDATVLYIDDDDRFIKQLKITRKLIVELPFVAGGRKQFGFGTQGFATF